MNIYVADDKFGSIIVDASISYMHGLPYYNSSFNKQTNLTSSFTTLFVDISVADTGLDLVSSGNVTVNSTANEFVFSLAGFSPQFEPYTISIIGSSGDGNHSYFATTQLYRLPDRSDGGSTVKIDNLYGGLVVQDFKTNLSKWTSLFPYTYYVLWDEWLGSSVDDLNVFAAQGYNTIHIVPTGTLGDLGDSDFPLSDLVPYLERAQSLGLWLHWSFSGSNYNNLTYVEQQVNLLKSQPNFLLWYSADEPDGQVQPLNSTKLAYNLIKTLDPYHPVSLALNCENFYFEEYSSGADIILSDVYPIAVNTSWSVVYDTPCNTTYGCCGCDNCDGNFEDVSNRFDLFASYQEILNTPQKPHWGAPQAFGNETFWSRYPTPGEELVMNMISVNHGAKGIVMWDYPSEPGIYEVTSALSKVLGSAVVGSFLLNSFWEGGLAVEGSKRVDVSAWTVGSQMLLSVVNLKYESTAGLVTVQLPAKATSVSSVLWGNGNWTVDGATISKNVLTGLEVDLLILEIAS
jgi:hypothetical protein